MFSQFDRVLLAHLASSFLLLLCGVLMLVFPLIMSSKLKSEPPPDTIARNLVLEQVPMTAAIANAILIFTATSLVLPALLMPTTRSFLKLQSLLTTASAFTSLTIGLYIWTLTLRPRTLFSPIYLSLPSTTQSLLQVQFSCCGYWSPSSPPYIPDAMCGNVLEAAVMEGCVGPWSRYANNVLDRVFTVCFGVVGVHFWVLMGGLMVLRGRKERERWAFVDGKVGVNGF